MFPKRPPAPSLLVAPARREAGQLRTSSSKGATVLGLLRQPPRAQVLVLPPNEDKPQPVPPSVGKILRRISPDVSKIDNNCRKTAVSV
jgi:hypothetical protein